MRATRKKPRSAERIARQADLGEDVSSYFTNTSRMMTAHADFKAYVRKRTKASKFANARVQARAEIETTDSIVRVLDAERKIAALTKATLARRVGTTLNVIERLFSSADASLPVVNSVAVVLGFTLGLKKARKKRPARRESR